MKILFPATHYYPVIGGIETWTQNITERFSDKAETFVVTGKVKNQPLKEIKNGVNIFRTSLFSLKNLSHSSPFYILTALPFIFFKSLNLVKREKVSLLHCQGFLSAFLGYLLYRIAKIPYIVTVQRLEEKRGFLRKLVYKNAKACIVASSAIKKYFEEIGAKNIKVIPNGIDLRRFENLSRQPHDKFTIITVARLEKVKGIEYLIGALSRSELRGRLDLQALIIGDGSERKNLENLVKRLELERKVKFLGEISNEKIPEYLTGADCFILPSLREGFGIAILEAQAAGVPVIGTKVGGILDLIEDGKTGILVEPKNSEAIAKAIQEIYSGRKFNKADLTKYNWQNIALEVIKIYEDCVRHSNLSA